MAGEGFAVEFCVRDVRQGASGGSYVVSYRAEVETVPGDGPTVVEVVSTIPEDADRVLLDHAVECIQRGAESVLRPLILEGRIRLHRLVIHDVDCNPQKYESATTDALASALAAESSA